MKKRGHESKKIQTRARKMKRLGLLFGGLFALLLLIIIGIAWSNKGKEETPEPRQSSTASRSEKKVFSPLTGLETTAANAKRPVTAVMIENSLEARPQSGLAEAGVVFEAVAEGGITRFVALYQEAQPSLIGPVRSVRPYFLEWASGFDSALAHVGGSAEALEMMRSGKYAVDLDQFEDNKAAFFWRTNDRQAPHNVYTSSEHLDKLMNKKEKKKSIFTSWPRQDSKEMAPTVQQITLSLSTADFLVQYNYNQEQQNYQRMQGGQPHLDREKGQIAPKVVVAMRVKMKLAADGNHNEIETLGQGKVYIFQNGTMQEGNWKKSSATEPVEFLDQEGKEIRLNRGQTWITAVPNDQEIAWQ